MTTALYALNLAAFNEKLVVLAQVRERECVCGLVGV